MKLYGPVKFEFVGLSTFSNVLLAEGNACQQSVSAKL